MIVFVDIDQLHKIVRINVINYTSTSDYKTLNIKVNYNYEYIPREIYNLTKLKFINIFGCNVKVIPLQSN